MENFTVTKTDRFTKRETTETVIFDGAAFRWACNGRVIPADAVEEYGVHLLPGFNAVAQSAARRAEVSDFLRDYRAANENVPVSAEERFEMRAAFGPGVDVVNVLTGRKVRT